MQGKVTLEDHFAIEATLGDGWQLEGVGTYWLAKRSGRVRVLDRFGESVAERAALELADAVVSPSAWLLDWFRAHRWLLPESAQVIQYLRQSAALHQPVDPVHHEGQVRRLAFFGQLREGKGIRIFLDALDQLDPVDVVFLGAASKRWPREELMRRAPGGSGIVSTGNSATTSP